MQRRSFLALAAGTISAAACGQSPQTNVPPLVHPVRSGGDRLGEVHNFGITTITFKVLPEDSNGNLLILEHANRAKGGPSRHLHPQQEEWFYAMEGEFVIEIGTERHVMHPGDSVLAPRNIPHVWAFAGDGKGKILISFTPAGKMEGFFRRVGATNAMPKQDAALFREFDMELLGPPLVV